MHSEANSKELHVILTFAKANLIYILYISLKCHDEIGAGIILERDVGEVVSLRQFHFSLSDKQGEVRLHRNKRRILFKASHFSCC